MSHRLPLAIALSLALHGALFVPDALRRPAAAPPPALQASLRLPPRPEPAQADTLLKNTLDAEEAPAAKPILPPPPASTNKARDDARSETRRTIKAAQKKIAANVFYPEAAKIRGIEGVVDLLIVLAVDGSADDVRVAVSSGHPVLDNAAVKAAFAAGRLVDARHAETPREIPVSVIFRLVP